MSSETETKKNRLGLLANPGFLGLWCGQIVSFVADRLAQMAFLGFLIGAYGRSGTEMARITFFSLLPSFLLGGVAGGVVDRLPRKGILVVSSLARAALVFAVGILFFRQTLPIEYVYGLIFLIGLCTAFFVPARLSILPGLVNDEDLQVANALTAGAGMIATLLGTYLSGIVIERAGFKVGFLANAALYVLAALCLLVIRPRKTDGGARTKSAQSFREAIAYLKSHRRALELLFLSMALSFLSSFFYIALTVLAMDHFHLGTEGTGKLLSMVGVGMLAGSAVAAWSSGKIRPANLLVVSFAALCAATLTARLADSYAKAWVWLMVIGAANAVILVTIDTVMQKTTPDRFRGKVFGIRGMLTNGVFLVSLLAVGELLKKTSPFDVSWILSLTSFAVAALVILTQENFAHLFVRFFARAFMRLFFSLQVEGEEFLRYKSKVILAGNHTGFLDGPLVVATSNRPVKFLVSRKVFSWRIVGPVVRRLGMIPVDDGRGIHALEAALAELGRGRAIGIFPEGRLTKDGSVGPFHKGVARLHKESGAPIVPFVIHGGYEAWPAHLKFPKFRKITLQFGQPIQASDRTEKEILTEVSERIRFMKAALERRERAKVDPKAYAESALALMQMKSDVYGGRTALLLKEGTKWNELSYIELSRKAADLSDFLMEGGLGKEDRVAILSESRPEWGVAFFAAIRSGAVVVPLDVKLTETELKSILTDAEPRVLFVSSHYIDAARALKSAIPSIERVVLLDRAEAEFPAYHALRAKTPLEGRERKPEETALIIYTSGTTGNPKGVMISFSNLVFEVRNLEELMRLTPNDLFLSILPLNHLLELTAGFMGVLHAGGKVCYSTSVNPQELAKVIKEKKVSFMITVPLFLKLLKSSIEKQIRKSGGKNAEKTFRFVLAIAEKIPSVGVRRLLFKKIHDQFGGRLRGFVSGGAPLDVEVGRFFQGIGLPVYQGYGLTETSPVLATNAPGANRMGSVGRALKGVEIKIAGDGSAEGEILSRGPHIMKGYYKKEDLTREAIDLEGWFHTGDLGKIDADGYLFITGRIKNLIVLGGGKKIHPEEVESALAESPAIKEVCVMARVLKGGLKDGTEEVCAVVTPSDDVKRRHDSNVDKIREEIQKEADRMGEKLASYKRPSSVWIHLDEMPKTSTRKIKRPLVAEWLKNQGEGK